MNWQMLQHFPLGNAHLTRYNIGVMNQSGARVSDTTHFPHRHTRLQGGIVCASIIPVIQGVPREDVLEVSKRWGYFSEKDNRLDEFDLCEQCYDEIISEFKIKI